VSKAPKNLTEDYPPTGSYTPAPSSIATHNPVPTNPSTPNPAVGTPLPTHSTIIPTLNPTQVIQQKEIKSVIQEYFDIHYNVLSISPPEDFQETGFGDLVSGGPDAEDFLVTEMGKLAVQKKHNELNGLLYVEYEYSLDYKDISVNQSANKAEATLFVYYDVIHEASAEANPKNPLVSKYRDGHTIILGKDQGEWKIISDIYWDSMWYTLRHPQDASTEEILHNIDEKMRQLEEESPPTP